MNKAETLEWIDLILDAMGRHETMAMINESINEFDGEFFETINRELERYTGAGDQAAANRLTEIARTIAALRQNRSENL